MSKMIVEVCEVNDVKIHPNADRLEICVVKGWNVISLKGQFQKSEKCIYIPYDAIIPPELANGPNDDPPGRLEVAKYCSPIKPSSSDNSSEILDETTVKPIGFRVRAARLRGERSFGIIVKIDEKWGDDPNWEIGTDIAEKLNITKWDPPESCEDGDAERPHPRFHEYVEIERYQNFPNVIQEGEDVVFTEKIHGKNNRIGIILDKDENGNAQWTWAAGSHSVRRKQSSPVIERFNAVTLVEKQCLKDTNVYIGQQFKDLANRFWQIEEIRPIVDDRILFRASRIHEDGSLFEKQSDFWMFLTENVQRMIEYIKDDYEWKRPKEGIIVFGEFFGSGVQSMAYGRAKKDFVVFDIAINGRYLDHFEKVSLCQKFDVPMVPILYRGPFSVAEMEKHTDGPTTMCEPNQAGVFKGREGIVITPTKERFSPELGGRTILKSVSVDYLNRQDISDNR